MNRFSYSAHIEGLTELQNAFGRADQTVISGLSRAITATAAPVEGSAKRHAPAHYGQLRASIHTTPISVTNRNIKAAVLTNLNYAQYQEEGTGIYGPNRSPIYPKRARMLSWISNGQRVFARSVRGTPGKHYMQQAWDEGKAIWDRNVLEAQRAIVAALAK